MVSRSGTDGESGFFGNGWRPAPAADAFAAKKGFTVPVGEWISSAGERLGPLVASQPGVAERCRPDAVEAIFRSTGKREVFAAWTLLFFALWHHANRQTRG